MLGEIAGMPRLVKQGQNPPQLRHQVARQLSRAILFGQGAKPLVPDPHRAIVARNVPRCNPWPHPSAARRTRDVVAPRLHHRAPLLKEIVARVRRHGFRAPDVRHRELRRRFSQAPGPVLEARPAAASCRVECWARLVVAILAPPGFSGTVVRVGSTKEQQMMYWAMRTSPHFLSVLIARHGPLERSTLRRSPDRRRGRWWTVHFTALRAVGE